MMSISTDIARQRLHTQRIAGEKCMSPDAVVHWFGAVQAQDYAGAKWAVGQRMHAATDAALDAAFAAGTILRTHVMRPTWHFVTPTDTRWLWRSPPRASTSRMATAVGNSASMMRP